MSGIILHECQALFYIIAAIILRACVDLGRQKTSHNMGKSNQSQAIMLKMDITDQVMKKKSKIKLLCQGQSEHP